MSNRKSTKRHLVFLTLIVILLTCPVARIPAAKAAKKVRQPDSKEKVLNWFPLRTGNLWVYKGWKKEESHHGFGKYSKTVFTWKMRVVKTIPGTQYNAAIVNGYADALDAGYDPEKSLILYSQSGKFYKDTGNRDEILKRLKSKSPDLTDLLKEEDLIFDLPLTLGKKFGYMEESLDYCWVVESKRLTRLTGIKGVSPLKKRLKYTLLFWTNPDHQIIEFVPGIGIVHSYYVHHGTIHEIDLRLQELRRSG